MPRVLDFTSSLYLGLRHPSDSLAAWAQLTTGGPAALGEPPVALRVRRALARLVGAPDAILSTSTLHVAHDLGGWLARERASLYVDDSAYPILRWAAERAHSLGARVTRVMHGDATSLQRALMRGMAGSSWPVVLTDGFCPRWGAAAPLGDYAALVGQRGGFVIVDDTQALGILGRDRSARRPYGVGGAGTPEWLRLDAANLVRVVSLAKGLAVPIAGVAGPRDLLGAMAGASQTRVHCSPPSFASLHAAARALEINAKRGDMLRDRLLANVRRFRRSARDAGVRLEPGIFPVQALVFPRRDVARRVHGALQQRGLRAVLTAAGPTAERGSARLMLIVTARHAAVELEQAIGVLANAIAATTSVPRLERTGTGAP